MSDLHTQMAQRLRMSDFHWWLKEVSPTFRWDWPHLRVVREALERVARGQCLRLMIFMPPRHGKTELATIRFPVWLLEQDPSIPIILGCYNQALANRFSKRARRIAEKRLQLASDASSVAEWETTAGGGLRAVGVGAGVTGTGGKVIIIDDPVKSREEAESEAYRERCSDWYDNDLYTRQEPGAAIVLIQTRWHEDDLGGRLLANMSAGGEQWEVINLAALAEADDPLGRPEGAALCPERYDEAALQRIKTQLGRNFSALYQQRPTPAEGDLLHVNLIGHAVPERAGLRVFQAWDLAISEKKTADYTACATLGVNNDKDAFLLHLWRGRVSFNETLNQMALLAAEWQPVSIGIETVSFQAAAFQEACRRHMLPFREIRADKDKVSRATLLANRIDAGKFYANRYAGWWADFETEAALFPNGKHDDMVDAVVHALALSGAGGWGQDPGGLEQLLAVMANAQPVSTLALGGANLPQLSLLPAGPAPAEGGPAIAPAALTLPERGSR